MPGPKSYSVDLTSQPKEMNLVAETFPCRGFIIKYPGIRILTSATISGYESACIPFWSRKCEPS